MLLLCGHVQCVVVIFLLEVFFTGHASLDACGLLLGGVRQQPGGDLPGRLAGYGQGGGLFGGYMEFRHVVGVVGSEEVLYVHFLSLIVNDNSSLSILEWGETTDGIAIVADKETIAAAQQRAVGCKCLQCENGSCRLLGPWGLGRQWQRGEKAEA